MSTIVIDATDLLGEPRGQAVFRASDVRLIEQCSDGLTYVYLDATAHHGGRLCVVTREPVLQVADRVWGPVRNEPRKGGGPSMTFKLADGSEGVVRLDGDEGGER